jgi:hypothetical protein
MAIFLVLLRFVYLKDVDKVVKKEMSFLTNGSSCSIKFTNKISKNGFF